MIGIDPAHSEPHIVPRRLHIGGQIRTPGWEVLDANPGQCVDHVANASDLRGFADNSFEQIYASHVVEHFDYRDQLVETLARVIPRAQASRYIMR